jgi:hypothetical protein
MDAYLIECRTGCTCCASDNHYRGPYRSREDAQRRVDHFLSPKGDCPIGSQYAPRGKYVIHSFTIELLPGDRYILDDRVYHGEPKFVEVLEDGSVSDYAAEIFDYA